MARVSLDDIRGVVPMLPGPDAAAAAQAGGDAELAWLAGWQGRYPPRLDHPRLVAFAGAHPGADVAGAKAAMTQLLAGQGPLAEAAAALDADLQLFDMGVANADPARSPGAPLSEAAAANAVAYGMTAVGDGLDAIAVIGLSAGGQALRDAAAAGSDDPLAAAARLGAPDLAAMMGALIAARMARTPALIAGASAEAARLLLARLAPGAADHVRTGVDPAQAIAAWRARLG
jgi:nicotinate-nucleotide--dimethylbenzimidazole phosphoribosyltransferase